MNVGKKIFIFSPHIDDAMLSMGGFILNRNDLSIDVINVFTITNYTINGILDKDFVTNSRKSEEIEVSRIAKFNVYFMDYVDAIIRVGENEKDYINVNYDECNDDLYNDLYGKIKRMLIENNYDSVFFPLGIGGHLDHILLFRIGEKLKLEGFNVCFYEDVAYEEALEKHTIKGMKMYIYKFSDIEKKIALIKKYETQVDGKIELLVRKTHEKKLGEVLWI